MGAGERAISGHLGCRFLCSTLIVLFTVCSGGHSVCACVSAPVFLTTEREILGC